MKINEAAALLDSMLNFWPGMLRDKDPEKMAGAWAYAMPDIPLRAAKKAAADLARTMRFPPTIQEIVEAARPYMVRCQRWDEKWARDCHECLGWDTPLYKKMQEEQAAK